MKYSPPTNQSPIRDEAHRRMCGTLMLPYSSAWSWVRPSLCAANQCSLRSEISRLPNYSFGVLISLREE